MFNRSLFVYRENFYDSWSSWSPCSPHSCLEHRYRRCADDSYTQPVSYLRSSDRVCPFKYIAEERPCEDKSDCLINGKFFRTSELKIPPLECLILILFVNHLAKPSEELKRMEEICGDRGSFDEKLKESRRKSGDDNDEEYDEEEESVTPFRRSRKRYELKILGGKSAKSLSWPWHVSPCGKFLFTDRFNHLSFVTESQISQIYLGT